MLLEGTCERHWNVRKTSVVRPQGLSLAALKMNPGHRFRNTYK